MITRFLTRLRYYRLVLRLARQIGTGNFRSILATGEKILELQPEEPLIRRRCRPLCCRSLRPGIKVLSLDQLIASKKALDQTKDREQLDQLLALRDLESRDD